MRIATISAAVTTLLISTGAAFALDSSVTMTSSMFSRRPVEENRRFLRDRRLASGDREMRSEPGRQAAHPYDQGRRRRRRGA